MSGGVLRRSLTWSRPVAAIAAAHDISAGRSIPGGELHRIYDGGHGASQLPESLHRLGFAGDVEVEVRAGKMKVARDSAVAVIMTSACAGGVSAVSDHWSPSLYIGEE